MEPPHIRITYEPSNCPSSENEIPFYFLETVKNVSSKMETSFSVERQRKWN